LEGKRAGDPAQFINNAQADIKFELACKNRRKSHGLYETRMFLSARGELSAPCDQLKYCFLGMQSILGLVEQRLGMRFEGFRRDFFASVSWETMHDNDTRQCGSNEPFIDLIWSHDMQPFSGFILLAHAHPNICV
jgi:hypothetical protein